VRSLLALLLLVGCPSGGIAPDDDDVTDDDDAIDDDDDLDDDDAIDDDDAGPVDGPVQEVSPTGHGASARWGFETAYGDEPWYAGANNETATLAWGKSYAMMSLAAMFRATGDPTYLSRLAREVDDVLAQRDDARGVSDYRGASAACWRNLHYQDDDEPYCYVVHSGMIGYPVAELARLVAAAGLEDEPDDDGVPFGDKLPDWIAAAEEVVAAHDDQWDPAGFYRFRADATFLRFPDRDVPFNQSNAMGRLLLALYDVTAEPAYLAKATALAEALLDGITTAGGAHRWNYWGGPWASPGEDVSHAAINVDFAFLAAEAGVVFDAGDLDGFSETFLQVLYDDDAHFEDYVGGGSASSSYDPQLGRWLRGARRGPVYAAVRQLYEAAYPPGSVGSGTHPLGWAHLAEMEPAPCEHFFYYVDWTEPADGWKTATAYGANILTRPPAWEEACLLRLDVDLPRAVTVQQWDGDAYHDVARWAPTAPALRFLAYDPTWPFSYWDDGALFQFADDWAAGGPRVRESAGLAAPTILSTPPAVAGVGEAFAYTAATDAAGPGWSLRRFAPGARNDPAPGAMRWTPPGAGRYEFTIELRTDTGTASQAFEVVAE